jgi:2-amino-4-hydroxy-6-hydroxymethyldihydropteridine diphosphokinase
MSTAYLLLGTNLGDKEQNLSNAVRSLKKLGRVKKLSPIYETEPWGFADERNFFNMDLSLETRLNPFELLAEILRIEISIGRTRQEKQWVAREIDIDIIFYDDIVIDEENLVIPHPHLKNRKFALVPLNEIAPSLIHPLYRKTLKQLLSECPDESEVGLLSVPSLYSISPN